jgi:hypothetical protein
VRRSPQRFLSFHARRNDPSGNRQVCVAYQLEFLDELDHNAPAGGDQAKAALRFGPSVTDLPLAFSAE